MRSSKWFILALVVVMVLSLAACGGTTEEPTEEPTGETGTEAPAEEPAEPVTVTFWHAMSEGHVGTLEEIKDAFEAEHENITVELVYQGSYGDLSTKLLAAINAGQPPVMAQMYEDWTSKFIGGNALVPVQNFIEDPDIGMTQEELDDIVGVFLDNQKWDDTIYTLPFNKSTTVMYYNTDLIDTPPATWDELIQMSKDLQKDTDGDGNIDQYGFIWGRDAGVDLFFDFLYQAGGTVLNEDGTEAAFNSEAGVEALNALIDLRNVSYVVDDYASGPFGDGVGAIYIGSSAGAPYVAEASEGKHGWSMAVLPEGEYPASEFMGTNVGIFAAASEAEQRAAFEFLKFAINTENTAKWAIATGYLPVRYSALETDQWKEFVASDPGRKAGTEMYDYGFFTPKDEDSYTIRGDISDAYEKATLGDMEPKAALDEAAAAVNEVLGK